MTDLSADALLESLDLAPKKKKGNLVQTIAVVGGLTLVGLAAGGGVGYLLGGQAPAVEAPAEKPAAEAAEGETAAASETPSMAGDTIIPVEQILTNLSSPVGTQVRLELGLLVHKKDVKDPDLLASQVEADTIAFLRSLDIAQIEGVRGLLHLKEDLTERARLRSPAVAGVLVRSLVVK